VDLQATEAFERAPQGWVLLQCILVHLYSFSSFYLPLIDLTEEVKACCAIGDLAEDAGLGVMLL
jgi:hypothetical protein